MPIAQYRDRILEALRSNPVLILQGGTATGKTTQLPQYLRDEMLAQHAQGLGRKGLIGCVQPRKITTKASARRVAQEVGCLLGEEVGYKVRFDDKTRQTEIKFMTDGTLMHELVKDPKLSKYSYIILDEAHVATVNASFLLPFLKRICKERPSDFKLIVSRQEFKFK
ncbi:Pre-mRNA-splicing factor ATP-dependent RNA helicase prp22 [Aphelenchoides avenae]|nr:Pre-mRNA-splicing factor ATP-dependent RNA helicase prp22 [Aphelenchus avenae]